MQFFDSADVERMIKLLADAADPTVDLTVAQRKTRLVVGLMELVGAESWIWLTGRVDPDVVAGSAPSLILDGGWDDAGDRTTMLGFIADPAVGSFLAEPAWAAVKGSELVTLSRKMIIDDRTWAESPIAARWRTAGFDSYMISIYPLGDNRYSSIGLQRRVGSPEFTDRERNIVHVLFQQVDWLHRDGADAPANSQFIELSPRERQVLMLLLGGDSRKLVASKLKLSEYTVGDYLKEIYRKFSVNSRSQLLSHFIAGGKDSNSPRLDAADDDASLDETVIDVDPPKLKGKKKPPKKRGDSKS
ncbi:MAG: helix-turn-helix transcriptional regulator [Pirellulales bacterium]